MSRSVLVVGGGPAGLRAAEIISTAGFPVTLADRMPSVGRKFLVAGRGGLNLTHAESVENFPARYGTEEERWTRLLADFSPADLRMWAQDLGIETFIGTSGRVFPIEKKAAPLLRRWVERLRRQGVQFGLRHDWSALRMNPEIEIEFQTPSGPKIHHPSAVVLALGGGSWPQTGSNGAWVTTCAKLGIQVSPLTAANCGYEVDWEDGFLARAEGLPLKNLSVRAGNMTARGELLITRYGLEGGALYQLGRALRSMKKPFLEIDLKPTYSAEELAAKLQPTQEGSLSTRAGKAWKLSPAASALLDTRDFATEMEAAHAAKNVRIFLNGPRPLAEAISSAGGVAWPELDDNLMLRRLPGIFCAGEMIDWDAPTGGYLLQGSLATATRAARGCLDFLATQKNLSPGVASL